MYFQSSLQRNRPKGIVDPNLSKFVFEKFDYSFLSYVIQKTLKRGYWSFGTLSHQRTLV